MGNYMTMTAEAIANKIKVISKNSKTYEPSFPGLLHVRTKLVLANSVFQEYIEDCEHVHLNATHWTSLTEFANDLGEQGPVTIYDSERGIMITYIDDEAEKLRRKKIEAERALQKESRTA